MEYRQWVLLAIGVVWVGKSAWGLFAPQSLKRTCEWWAGMTANVGSLIGWCCVGIAGFLFYAAIIDITFVEKLIGLVALMLAASASFYFKPQSLLRLMDTLIVRRSNLTVRLIFLTSMLIGFLLILVAVTDYNPF